VKVVLIEIACRGGGTLISSDIVKWVSGIDVYDLLHENLIGNVTDLRGLMIQRRSAVLHFFEFPSGKVKRISGIEKIQKMPCVAKVLLAFKEGDVLSPAEDDRSRQGFVIVFAHSRKELQAVLAEVESTVEVEYE
jgi:hypothetical protein